jgi:hypothetical protein
VALRRVLDEVLFRPERDLPERGQQCLAAVGQGVGDGEGRPLVDGAGDEAGGAEVAEPVRQDRVGDPVDRARELTEAGGASVSVVATN